MSYDEVRNGTKPWAGLPLIIDMPAGIQTTHKPRSRAEHFAEYGVKPLEWLEGVKQDVDASTALLFTVAVVSWAVSLAILAGASRQAVQAINSATPGWMK